MKLRQYNYIGKTDLDDYTVIYAEAKDILPIYKSMRRAWREDKASAMPLYRDLPKVEDGRIYGILIEFDLAMWKWIFSIITADTILRIVPMQ